MVFRTANGQFLIGYGQIERRNDGFELNAMSLRSHDQRAIVASDVDPDLPIHQPDLCPDQRYLDVVVVVYGNDQELAVEVGDERGEQLEAAFHLQLPSVPMDDRLLAIGCLYLSGGGVCEAKVDVVLEDGQ